jgi:hypothetical protein
MFPLGIITSLKTSRTSPDKPLKILDLHGISGVEILSGNLKTEVLPTPAMSCTSTIPQKINVHHNCNITCDRNIPKPVLHSYDVSPL